MLVLSLLRACCVTVLIYLTPARVPWALSLSVINGRQLYIAGGMNICLAVDTANTATTSGPHLLDRVPLLSDYIREGLTWLSTQHAAGFGSTQ